MSASEFVKEIRRKKKIIPEYSIDLISFIKKSYSVVEKIDCENIKESFYELEETPAEIVDLCKIAKRYGDFCYGFFNSLKAFKPIKNISMAKDAIEDISCISKEVKDIHLNVYEKTISFKIEVIMKDVYRDIEFNFGEFSIYMREDGVDIVPIKNNTVRNGQYHPYAIINSSKLCLGAYLEPYKESMKYMRYHAAYLLVIQCLTQYGGDMLNGKKEGPQNPIELWVGQICSICDGQVASDRISVCSKTHRAICPSCVDTGMCVDEIDNELYHPDILKTCKQCNFKTSTVIRGTCLKCRKEALIK